MARKKSSTSEPKQGPPLQFRPGAELQALVDAFAALHAMTPNEACKVLVAIASAGMDLRFYALLEHLAKAMGGLNPFVRACLHIKSRLDGAVLVSRDFIKEPARSLLILKVVQEYLAIKGRKLPDMDLWFVNEERNQGADQAAEQAEVDEGRAWSSFDQQEGEQERVRP